MQVLRSIAVTATIATFLLPSAASADPGDKNRAIPKGHLPPPGECRVWIPGVPPGQQREPTDCRRAHEDAYYEGGWVIYGGGEGRDDDRW